MAARIGFGGSESWHGSLGFYSEFRDSGVECASASSIWLSQDDDHEQNDDDNDDRLAEEKRHEHKDDHKRKL